MPRECTRMALLLCYVTCYAMLCYALLRQSEPELTREHGERSEHRASERVRRTFRTRPGWRRPFLLRASPSRTRVTRRSQPARHPPRPARSALSRAITRPRTHSSRRVMFDRMCTFSVFFGWFWVAEFSGQSLIFCVRNVPGGSVFGDRCSFVNVQNTERGPELFGERVRRTFEHGGLRCSCQLRSEPLTDSPGSRK